MIITYFANFVNYFFALLKTLQSSNDASKHKKNPKSNFNILEGIFTAKIAPKKEKNTPPAIKYPIPFIWIKPFLLCINIETIAITKKLNKLIPCAIVCSTPKKIVSKGINNVPPPIPSPPKTPEITPKSTCNITIK